MAEENEGQVGLLHTPTHPSPRTRAGGWLSNGLPRRQPTRPPLCAHRRAHQGAGRRGQDGISRAGDRDRRADGRGGKAQARQRGGGARATTCHYTPGGGERLTQARQGGRRGACHDEGLGTGCRRVWGGEMTHRMRRGSSDTAGGGQDRVEIALHRGGSVRHSKSRRHTGYRGEIRPAGRSRWLVTQERKAKLRFGLCG